jgi:septal ring factor EnvC (AmiA/AmiB activator)
MTIERRNIFMVDKTSKPSENTKTSKAKIDANRRYNEKTFDVLQCRIRKEEHINQRIDAAVTAINATIDNPKAKISKASFILDAIKAKLDATMATGAQQQRQHDPFAGAPKSEDKEPIKVLLPRSEHYNERIAAIVKAGYAPSRATYVMQALNEKLVHDEAKEKTKLDRYFAGYDG